MRLIKKTFLLLGLVFVSVSSAFAETEEGTMNSLWEKFKNNTSETWNEPTNYSLFVPVNTWHNRLAYDKEKVKEYNEEPWGLGFGVSRYDEQWDWHSLYFMAFKDSNDHLQTIFGYAYQKNWYFNCNRDWYVGAGFTLSLTQRVDYSMIPVPLPLPLVGAGYKNIAVQAAYVPGVKNNGNVLFTWVRADF